MKTRRVLLTTALVLLAVVTTSSSTVGQEVSEQRRRKIPRYKLVDLGTFGGRASYVNPAWELGGPNQMNGHGATVGSAATSVPTFLGCPFCNGLDGQVQNVFHAFKWSDGVLKDLGALPGELTNSVAISINAEGTAVGHSENGLIDPITGVREFRAVLWKDGKIRNLGTFGGNHSVAAMINNRGQVVGSALNTAPDPFSLIGLFLGSSDSTQTRAFLWENGHKRDLGTLGGPDAFAGAVNERGEVAGGSYINSIPNPTTGTPTRDPFLWRKGKMIDLGNFGGNLGGATYINNRTQVIGELSLPGDQFVDPFFWDNGKLVDLYTDTLGTNPQTAHAINDAGEIVGAGSFPDHPYDAYVWKNGVATDLGSLDGDCYSEAFIINSKGQIAGQSFSCDGSTVRAFLWQDGTMFDLNEVIRPNSDFKFTQAFVINDRGEIGGIGTGPDCDFDEDCGHALVLIPTSEHADNERDGTASIATANLPRASVNSVNAMGAGLTPREIGARIRARFGRRGLPGSETRRLF